MASDGNSRWAFFRTASGPESGSVTGIFGSTTVLLSSGRNSLISAAAGFSRLLFWVLAGEGCSVQPNAVMAQRVAEVRYRRRRLLATGKVRGGLVADMLCTCCCLRG